jgi:hypothetical protein
MLIEGPMNVTITEPADGEGKILVIAFTPDFQALDPTAQGQAFRGYLTTLSEGIAASRPEDLNRQGMIIIQQIAEQLLPHVESGELALEESMTVQIRQENQAGALVDLLAEQP